MGKRGKAQIVAHPIVVLFLLIGFIMLLIIGLKIYNSIKENQCKSTLVSWETNLKNDVMEIALREGSARQRTYTELCGTDSVYFVDSKRNIPQDAFNKSIEIQNHIFGKTEKNLFLIKKKRLFASLFIGDLHLEHPHYICFNTTAIRKLDLLIVGKGDSASIVHLENNKGTTYDCTDYSLPREIEVNPSLDKASSILTNSSTYLERTFSLSPQEALKRYNETSEKVEIDREFQRLNTSTRVKVKIRPKSPEIIDNFIYIEDIPKACLGYLSDYSIEVENGEIINYDPVIAWHFAAIETREEAVYTINDAELEANCKDLIDGVGLAENFVDNLKEVKNDPPILSIPDITLTEDSNLSIDLSDFVADPDNIKKDIKLTSAKSINMNIQLNNFSLLIIPNPNWYGEERIAFSASDKYNTTIQEILIRVTSVNDPPVITSEPKINAIQYKEYNYKVIANDIENNQIAFSLVNYPVGMSIDANGNIAWTPAKSGVYNVKVQATDIYGLSIIQTYVLTVQRTNQAPTIAKIPDVRVNGSLGLKDNVVPNLWIFTADDADPKNLEYSISSQSNPDLVPCFVDSQKNLDCNVKNNDDGHSDVIIQVSDGEFSSYTTLRVTVRQYIAELQTCSNSDTSCGTFPNCNNCNNQDTYSANYCSGNSVYRNFVDYSCSSQTCSSAAIPQLQQNCAGNNGICQNAQCSCANTVSSCGTYPSCLTCGENQACPNNQCVSQICSDGTPIESCSTTKPLYCNSGGQLVNGCSACGCPSGKACQGDGSCVNAIQLECKTTYKQDCDGNDVYMYDSCSGQKIIKKRCNDFTCMEGKCCYRKKFLWFKWWVCI